MDPDLMTLTGLGARRGKFCRLSPPALLPTWPSHRVGGNGPRRIVRSLA